MPGLHLHLFMDFNCFCHFRPQLPGPPAAVVLIERLLVDLYKEGQEGLGTYFEFTDPHFNQQHFCFRHVFKHHFFINLNFNY